MLVLGQRGIPSVAYAGAMCWRMKFNDNHHGELADTLDLLDDILTAQHCPLSS